MTATYLGKSATTTVRPYQAPVAADLRLKGAAITAGGIDLETFS